MDLEKISASEAAEAIRKKEIKVRELTEKVLALIKEKDQKHKAFIRLTPELALKQADKNDSLIEEGKEITPLTGLPFAYTDDFSLQDVESASCSNILKGLKPPFSASVIEKAEVSGVVTAGKTNIGEFGMGYDTDTSCFQATENPLESGRVAGCGSAAAVSYCGPLIGISTDTAGELRLAASFCGVTALRPTAGTVSRYGISMYASSFSQVGIAAKKAADLLPAFELLKGYDPKDSATSFYNNYDSAGTGRGIKEKPVIGFLPGLLENIDSEKASVFQEVNSFFSDSDYKIKELSIPYFEEALLAFHIIAMAESFSNLSRYDSIRFGNYLEEDSLEERYVKTRSEFIGTEAKRRSLMGAYLTNNENYSKYYTRALKVKSALKKSFDIALEEVDVIMLPAAASTAPDRKADLGFTEKYEVEKFCAPISLTGLPAVVVPAGYCNKMPLGMQIVGRHFSEHMLSALADFYQSKAGK